MRKGPLIGLLVGLAGASLLFVWQGLESVIDILSNAGWALLLVCLVDPPGQVLWSEAWRRLFPRERRPGVFTCLGASWIGAAVNSLLPVATVGGDVVKARVLTLWSYSATDALSTAVVDKAMQAVAALLWILVGIAVLTLLVPDPSVVTGAAIGAALLAVGIGGFIGLQLSGSLSLLARPAGRLFGARGGRGLLIRAGRLDRAIRAVYRRPVALISACSLLFIAQIWLVSEILIASHLMGHPLGIAEAVMLRALTVGLRGIAFAVPGGLGVQEGGYVAVGGLLGLPADFMLALSLATRVREMVPSVPFLFAWQHLEGRALLRRRLAEAGQSR